MKPFLDSKLLRKALTRLAEFGREAGIEIELNVYGGAAMILAYDVGRRTNDVDAIFRPREDVLSLSARVAEEFGFDRDWLNDEVQQFTAPVESKRELPLEIEGLRVQVPTAAYLLAMKTRAAREPMPGYDGDREDLLFLIKKMEIRSFEQLEEKIDQFFPDDVISNSKVPFLQQMIEEVWQDE